MPKLLINAFYDYMPLYKQEFMTQGDKYYKNIRKKIKKFIDNPAIISRDLLIYLFANQDKSKAYLNRSVMYRII